MMQIGQKIGITESQRLVGNLVTWKSKKHKVISRSSVEAKYRAIPIMIEELD